MTSSKPLKRERLVSFGTDSGYPPLLKINDALETDCGSPLYSPQVITKIAGACAAWSSFDAASPSGKSAEALSFQSPLFTESSTLFPRTKAVAPAQQTMLIAAEAPVKARILRIFVQNRHDVAISIVHNFNLNRL